MKINNSFGRAEELKYLTTTITDQNCIKEDMKSRLRAGNGCCHSVQNVLYCSLLYKNLKIKIDRIIILPLSFNGCKTWSLTLKEKRRQRAFENRMLSRIFGSKRDEVAGEWRKLHNEELTEVYCSPNIVRMTNSRRMRWEGNAACMGEEKLVQGFGGET